MNSVILMIAVMAVTTYLIRMIPFVFFRKKIKNKFVQNLLYYIPYAVLSAMTIPAIFYATNDLVSSIAGTITAVILALLGCPLIVVALAASGVAYLVMRFFPFL